MPRRVRVRAARNGWRPGRRADASDARPTDAPAIDAPADAAPNVIDTAPATDAPADTAPATRSPPTPRRRPRPARRLRRVWSVTSADDLAAIGLAFLLWRSDRGRPSEFSVVLPKDTLIVPDNVACAFWLARTSNARLQDHDSHVPTSEDRVRARHRCDARHPGVRRDGEQAHRCRRFIGSGGTAVDGIDGLDTGTAKPPNILVILVDDLGYGDLFLWRLGLAEPGRRPGGRRGHALHGFHSSSPVCSPTRAALLTGRYPDLVGVPGVIRQEVGNSWGNLADDATLLAQPLATPVTTPPSSASGISDCSRPMNRSSGLRVLSRLARRHDGRRLHAPPQRRELDAPRS